jgi:hypothetical protein
MAESSGMPKFMGTYTPAESDLFGPYSRDRYDFLSGA